MSGTMGGFEQRSLRAEQSTGHLHTAPSPHARAPIINNSCPGYVNPALESTSPQIPLILELLPAVQPTILGAECRGGLSPAAKALLHFLGISSYYQVYGSSLPLTTRVQLRFLCKPFAWLPTLRVKTPACFCCTSLMNRLKPDIL